MSRALLLGGAALFAVGAAWGMGAFLIPQRLALRGARRVALAGLVFLGAGLALEALRDGASSFSNLGGTLASLAWLLAAIAWAVSRPAGLPAILPFAMPLSALLLAAAAFCPEKSWDARGAVSALHGGSSVLGYAAFATSFTMGLMYLALDRILHTKGAWGLLDLMPSLSTLDRWNGLAAAWGFPFLTLATATGILRARQAWGAHWYAEPIVVGVLAAWLLYGGLLAGRHGAGLRGRRVAILSVVAFGVGMGALWAGHFFGGSH